MIRPEQVRIFEGSPHRCCQSCCGGCDPVGGAQTWKTCSSVQVQSLMALDVIGYSWAIHGKSIHLDTY